jgi:hypothetical protein
MRDLQLARAAKDKKGKPLFMRMEESFLHRDAQRQAEKNKAFLAERERLKALPGARPGGGGKPAVHAPPEADAGAGAAVEGNAGGRGDRTAAPERDDGIDASPGPPGALPSNDGVNALVGRAAAAAADAAAEASESKDSAANAGSGQPGKAASDWSHRAIGLEQCDHPRDKAEERVPAIQGVEVTKDPEDAMLLAIHSEEAAETGRPDAGNGCRSMVMAAEYEAAEEANALGSESMLRQASPAAFLGTELNKVNTTQAFSYA